MYDNSEKITKDMIERMRKISSDLWGSNPPPTIEDARKLTDEKNIKPWQERIMKHDEKIALFSNLLTKIYDLQAKGLTISEIAKEVDLPESAVRHYLHKDILSSTYGTIANDQVNHPSHYTDGKIEVIDFIEDKKLGFHLGNAVKYISRAGKKDPRKTVEDLKKAIWYIQRKIDQLSGDIDGDPELIEMKIEPLTGFEADLIHRPIKKEDN